MAGVMLRCTGSLSLLDIPETPESPGERMKALEQHSVGPKTRGDLGHSPVASLLWVHLSSPSSPPAHKRSISVSGSSQRTIDPCFLLSLSDHFHFH